MTRPPRRYRLALALVALTVSACGRGEAAPGDGAPGGDALGPSGEYEVVFEAVDLSGSYVLTANGFPVERPPLTIRARPGQEFGAFLTPALVSGENRAAVEVVPSVRRTSGGVAAGPVRLRLWVEGPDGSVVPGSARGVAASDSAFGRWRAELERRWPGWVAAEDSALAADPALARALADSVGRDPRAGAYGVGPALDSARAWAAAHPVVVATAFVRPGGARPSDGAPSFDAVFRSAPVIRGTAADSARLRDYAVRLRDLTVARDTAALWDEFEPAFADDYLVWGGAEGTGVGLARVAGRRPGPPRVRAARAVRGRGRPAPVVVGRAGVGAVPGPCRRPAPGRGSGPVPPCLRG